ncbi:hypothetical protein [Stakelama tenebrarum]|uniref:Uncharacterized protein n=1 Tax=Stakelama tenebrarum TaxID=2711215 RepID=A0A6G6Y864_9SPHN|nr:hypothetical protein [Sphingosinithalassobacter tenebrarum]QIG81134.1 hypothetical protein G5C33_16015 [Sphingosinithalassobacter tenebrarum]
MEQLSPAYFSAIATQTGNIAAFLGGFAATYLATLLTLTKPSRIASITIGCAAIAAICFIISVAAATTLVAMLHPEAPAHIADNGVLLPRVLMALPFALGMCALLGSIGASGWLRSRRTGWTTSIAAGIGLVAILPLIVG